MNDLLTRLSQTFLLKIQYQGHGWGQRKRSHSHTLEGIIRSQKKIHNEMRCPCETAELTHVLKPVHFILRNSGYQSLVYGNLTPDKKCRLDYHKILIYGMHKQSSKFTPGNPLAYLGKIQRPPCEVLLKMSILTNITNMHVLESISSRI